MNEDLKKQVNDLEHSLHINGKLTKENEKTISAIKNYLAEQNFLKRDILVCIELLNIDGINSKEKVKSKLKQILEGLK